MLQGQLAGQEGEEILSTWVRLSTERVIQEAWAQEQAEALGRGRDERREGERGDRNGDEAGTLKTAAGVVRVEVPQLRGREEPYGSEVWSQVAKTRDVLQRLLVEMDAGGLSQREIAYRGEKALGQVVLSKSAVRELTDAVTQEAEGFRTRDVSGEEGAYLFRDAVSEPLRRWGRKTGVFGVWAIGVAGRKVRLTLSTANRESSESGLAVLRELVKRGRPTPVTITTDGVPGLTKASEVIWPKSLRLRCWLHKRPNLQQKGPPPAWPECKALGMEMRAAPPVTAAEHRRQALVTRYQRDFPAAGGCLLDDPDASLNHLYVPQRHQQYVRTSTLAERAVEEDRRRTKVIPHLWDEGSVTKLVFAVLIRVSERWGKKCFSEFAQQHLRSLRRQRQLDEQTVVASPTHPQPRRSAAAAA